MDIRTTGYSDREMGIEFRIGKKVGNAFFGIVIDPAKFADGSNQMVKRLVDYVKSAKTMPGFDQIYYPGEIEQEILKDRKANGIPITDDTWRLVQKALYKLDLSFDVLV